MELAISAFFDESSAQPKSSVPAKPSNYVNVDDDDDPDALDELQDLTHEDEDDLYAQYTYAVVNCFTQSHVLFCGISQPESFTRIR